MSKKLNSILKRINEIEKNIQEMKIDLLFNFSKKEKLNIYQLKDILNEVKKIRKELWNEKYSKNI
jgi:predicted RNA-binding protein with EMAP domain